jgi:hypothetical protein
LTQIKIFRPGKGTFCEWRFENGRNVGRIQNQGAGIFLDNTFLTAEEVKSFCETELEKDASLIFYIVQRENIIDFIQNDDYHNAKEAKQNRLFVAVTTAVVMLLASVVSFIFMPFQLLWYDALFIVAMGVLYLMIYSVGGRLNVEGVVLMIVILLLLSIMVPMLSR